MWYNQPSWYLLRHMPTLDQQDNNSALVQACKDGNLDEVQRLLPTSNPRAHNNSAAVRWAADAGHLEIVRLLAPLSDLQSCLAVQAAANGHAECVRLLIPVSDANLDEASPLFKSAQRGHTECVQLLLPVTDPTHYPRALNFAAMEGHRDCVEILMSVVSTDEHSNALRTASRYSRHDVVDVLFETSDVDTALDILKGQYPNAPQYWQHLKDKVEAFHAQQQNQVLRNEIAHSGVSVVRKM